MSQPEINKNDDGQSHKDKINKRIFCRELPNRILTIRESHKIELYDLPPQILGWNYFRHKIAYLSQYYDNEKR